MTQLYLLGDTPEESKSTFIKMLSVITDQMNMDIQILTIKELLKSMFNFGILKINKKKSTLEEIEAIKKDSLVIPFSMVLSKINNILKVYFNSIQ